MPPVSGRKIHSPGEVRYGSRAECIRLVRYNIEMSFKCNFVLFR